MMREELTELLGGLKRTMNALADLIVLNILMLVCALPIITAGAAIVASYTCILRVLRGGETAFPVKAFFAAFRTALPKAKRMWLLVLLCVVIVAGDYYYAVYLSSPPNRFFLVFAIVMAVLLMLTGVWLFPLMARFENTLRGHIKNAVLMAVALFPKTLTALLIQLCFYALPFFVPAIFLYLGWLWLLMGLTLPMYCTALLFRKELACVPILPDDTPVQSDNKTEPTQKDDRLV